MIFSSVLCAYFDSTSHLSLSSSPTMAACGSLHTILYDNSLPQNPPSILDSLSSWNLLESVKNTVEEDPCYTEIYSDDIHLKENENNATPPTPLSSASSGEMVPPPAEAVAVAASSIIESIDKEKNEKIYESISGHRKQYKHSDSFSSQNSETLSLCTESLGFESSDDVLEDLRNENCFFDAHINEDNRSTSRHSPIYTRRSRTTTTTCKGPFPPPISCIGKTGKPWVYFQTYRQDGRFILQEVRIPTQEFLHSCREDGRLRMQLIQSDEEGDYDDDDDDDDDEDDDFGTVEE